MPENKSQPHSHMPRLTDRQRDHLPIKPGNVGEFTPNLENDKEV